VGVIISTAKSSPISVAYVQHSIETTSEIIIYLVGEKKNDRTIFLKQMKLYFATCFRLSYHVEMITDASLAIQVNFELNLLFICTNTHTHKQIIMHFQNIT